MMRAKILSLAALAFLTRATMVNADVWSPSPPPALTPSCIAVGPVVEMGYCAPNNATITVTEGNKIKLNAKSVDFDTLASGSGPSQLVPDQSGLSWEQDPPIFRAGPTVVWTSNAPNSLSGGRVLSGTVVEWTAPPVPQGMTEQSWTITIYADDGTLGMPGRIDPATKHTGNRDDFDSAGLTITIRVIKACPTTLTVASTCQVPQAANQPYSLIWQNAQLNAVQSWGWLSATMQVGGGTPPNPPNNWNGLVITEQVALHPTVASTMTAADFTGGEAPATVCTGGGHFVVGYSQGGLGFPGPPSPLNVFNQACPVPAADNRFYDLHAAIGFGGLSLAKPAVAGKTVVCQQKYFCGTTQLSANGSFKITRTYTATTWTPPSPPNPPNQPARPVTEIVIEKVAEP